jgi:arylformamidase
MTSYVDVTVPLVPDRVPLYPGDTQLEVKRVRARAAGESANVSKLVCSLHCGTHVDGPAHFFDGQPGVEAVPTDVLIGPAWVVIARSVEKRLDAAALSGLHIPARVRRVLFLTINSALWDDPRFVEDFVTLTCRCGAALIGRGVRLVGIDYLSIAPNPDEVVLLGRRRCGGVAADSKLRLQGQLILGRGGSQETAGPASKIAQINPACFCGGSQSRGQIHRLL